MKDKYSIKIPEAYLYILLKDKRPVVKVANVTDIMELKNTGKNFKLIKGNLRYSYYGITEREVGGFTEYKYIRTDLDSLEIN